MAGHPPGRCADRLDRDQRPQASRTAGAAALIAVLTAPALMSCSGRRSTSRQLGRSHESRARRTARPAAADPAPFVWRTSATSISLWATSEVLGVGDRRVGRRQRRTGTRIARPQRQTRLPSRCTVAMPAGSAADQRCESPLELVRARARRRGRPPPRTHVRPSARTVRLRPPAQLDAASSASSPSIRDASSRYRSNAPSSSVVPMVFSPASPSARRWSSGAGSVSDASARRRAPG